MLFWHPTQTEQHFIWFLRLPLDEQGLLVPDARDAFLAWQLEKGLTNPLQGGQQSADDAPFTFRPRDDRMAVFHAKATRILGQPPSQYHAHALRYLRGELGYKQWAFVGLQGLADVAARLDQDDAANALTEHLPQLPPQPFAALCGCLENEAIDGRLARSLGNIVRLALAANDGERLISALRALSATRATELRDGLLTEVLNHPMGQQADILLLIAARLWESLKSPAVVLHYCETLAGTPSEIFDACLTDLLFLPGMRAPIMAALRDENRSPRLAGAVGRLFRLAGR